MNPCLRDLCAISTGEREGHARSLGPWVPLGPRGTLTASGQGGGHVGPLFLVQGW